MIVRVVDDHWYWVSELAKEGKSWSREVDVPDDFVERWERVKEEFKELQSLIERQKVPT